MFMLVGEAYRSIEIEHNPLLREARKYAAETYDKGPSERSNFKSRRPENKGERAFYEGEDDDGNH